MRQLEVSSGNCAAPAWRYTQYLVPYRCKDGTQRRARVCAAACVSCQSSAAARLPLVRPAARAAGPTRDRADRQAARAVLEIRVRLVSASTVN